MLFFSSKYYTRSDKKISGLYNGIKQLIQNLAFWYNDLVMNPENGFTFCL